MTDIQTRNRDSWASLFDQVSLGRHGEAVSIEILSDDLGDQTEADLLPLESLSYDDRGDVAILSLAGRGAEKDVVLRHLIHQPREVDVHEQAENTLVMRIVDLDGAQTLLTFRPQLARD
jgi:hypothetical protein